ncbi:MAG TPA: haloacid dehalogenase-like hydrolase [Thermoanaerobaculia bacterium]|jgi:phosphoglycolate phosphatase-like HAD superfamily hydrolase|nr:haloacid dehalogenase-like hydrolase [Thermoanaerobaculia bacterium]
MRRLALFDIDGTLITDGGAARLAFAEALRIVYGYEGDVRRYDFSGRTDPQIASMVLRDAGLTDAEIESRFDDLWHAYLEGLSQNAKPERVHALPGIPQLLSALQRERSVMLGLLTGNIEPGARLKLAPPRLNDYFPFGAFGSDSANREDLPPIAVERASRFDGHRFAGADVVIIGDSIYDIRCGIPYDATTIAIASGKTPAETLKAENPRHFFDSAEDLGPMLKAILG